MTDRPMISYRALGLDRETALRRARAWKRHASEMGWEEDDPNDPRGRHLARAHRALLAHRDALPEEEVFWVLSFGIQTPSDDMIAVALDFDDAAEFPEPAIRGYERRRAEAARIMERFREIKDQRGGAS